LIVHVPADKQRYVLNKIGLALLKDPLLKNGHQWFHKILVDVISPLHFRKEL
jgi:hypothetical protein